MRAKSVIPAVVVLSAASFWVSARAYADERGRPSALRAGIVRAADHHISLEGSYANGDTGTGQYLCAWEWEVGTGLAYQNTQGASARGLVEAYKVTHTRAYLAGARCAAKQVISRYDANPTNRWSFGDLLLLLDLSEATFDHTLAARARSAFEGVRAQFPTGAALADHDLARRSLAGWDAAAQIEVALAVEQEDYARSLALEVLARRADWENLPLGGTDYTLLSQGALLEALSELEGKTIRHARDELRRHLLQAQAKDGSWADGDFQTTAFVLRGLLASPDSREVRRARAGALRFLLSRQMAGGGWSSPSLVENGEVNGEVLDALAAAIPHHDCEDDDDRDFDEPRPGHWGHRPARADDAHGDR